MRILNVVFTVLIAFVVFVHANAQQITGSEKLPDPSAQFDWFKIADNIYQFRYQGHYTLFVTTSKGVIAFDPLSNEAAEHYAAAIKTVAPGQPLLAIIYSHWHVDHSSGAKILKREFAKAVPIIAHERTLSRLKRWDDPEILLPTQTVSDKGSVLNYGNMKIELNYIGYGHTDTMLVARFPEQRLVFAVDFVNNDAVGWTDLPGWYLGELIAMQGRLLKLDFDTVAFGHGMPGDKATIKRQIGYYKDLTSQAKLALRQGLSEDEAVTKIEAMFPQYKQWRFYDMWFLMNIRGAYHWAQNSNDHVNK